MDHQIMYDSDLFEPIEDRIELKMRPIRYDDESGCSVYKKSLGICTKNELILMEQAINGELFNKKSIKAIMKYAVKRAAFKLGEGCVDYNWVKDWLKQESI
ncbi:MAG TPA: hypothetical protein ENH82_00680 [bacterium]|nr:hypothetical protein [bacterium]